MVNKNKCGFCVSSNLIDDQIRETASITKFSHLEFSMQYLGCPLYKEKKRKKNYFNTIVAKDFNRMFISSLWIISSWNPKNHFLSRNIHLDRHLKSSKRNFSPPLQTESKAELSFYFGNQFPNSQVHLKDVACLSFQETGLIRLKQDVSTVIAYYFYN
ncbi:hypothetical protein H5410_047052 [Solanum commersonii]|uniref:Uncharacterized protein n=1 Tax=Solanum commersonii TaxID=4109 RepID=A0A9J5XG35_SOLCO|nr:hypothetical protein H5410_047052 [Solanum commersonii]